MSFLNTNVVSSKYFDEALGFLKEYQWIFNYPNTDILSKNILDEIPSEWIAYFNNLSFSDFKDLALCKYKNDCPRSLVDYFEKVRSLNIQRNKRNPKPDEKRLRKNHRLSHKKHHEIISLAPLVAEFCAEADTHQVIDIGAGLGYLSHMLAEDYNCSVLAIEGCPEKTELALKAQMKHHTSTREHVTFYNHFITENSAVELNEVVKKKFSNEKNISMCGLHACADLSVTILDLFLKMDRVKTLAIMPCCYHRMGLKETRDEREYFKCFPLSRTLKYEFDSHDASTYLRRPFLRLACQQTLITFLEMSDEQHEEHARNFLMRAVLQKAADEAGCYVSRLKRKSGKSLNESDFSFYLKNFCKNYKLVPKNSGGETELTNNFDVERRITEIWENNKDKFMLVEALSALQNSIQSVCENILLQDRVQFLLENGVNCDIQKVTDDNISPRCYALVAIKQ
ncbi:protein RRNAD1 isoform X2 [Coccinella septempunctata]|uniref:protein RRNAD1 isoform X2 n=1 Tax=Coccinella septempunctata TaxID=41139 RepID=UPI001D07061E|nr:protein RRNAD1 isoform X2 [Coccinella septempunctata]XP_044747597.1 protein RRNAD1 isoform X2 [Coccinella septempunctata]